MKNLLDERLRRLSPGRREVAHRLMDTGEATIGPLGWAVAKHEGCTQGEFISPAVIKELVELELLIQKGTKLTWNASLSNT